MIQRSSRSTLAVAHLAIGATLASTPVTTCARPLSFNSAIEIAKHELAARGLGDDYQVAGIYSGEDRHAEGAAFAVVIKMNPSGLTQSGASQPRRLKLLIQNDGGTSLQPCQVVRNRKAS